MKSKGFQDKEIHAVFQKLDLDWEEVFLKQSLILIRQHWKQIAGEFLSLKSYPLQIQGTTLIVMTEHSLISQEIQFQSQNWIEQLKRLSLPKPVHKIQLKTGNLAIYRQS